MGFKSYSIETIFTNRPTLKHYAFLDGEVRELVDYTIKQSLKANEVLRLKSSFSTKQIKAKQSDFWFLPWSTLLEIREAVIEQNLVEVFRLVYGINQNQFLSLDVFNAFSAYKWVIQKLEDIALIEKQELGDGLTPEEKEAGAEALKEFGYSVTLDSLAKGNILRYNKILKKPYAVIFRKMCLDKTNNEIKKNYSENASRKNKRGLSSH